VGGYHLPDPPTRMEHADHPDLDRVLDGVDRLLEH
jgi:pyruvate dehydrogenase E1 component beta subunit